MLEKEDELYNNGGAFKLTCRDESGVIVTIIADNYFGYCKKEVKTQISYAANCSACARRNAGGALMFLYMISVTNLAGRARPATGPHVCWEVAQNYAAMMDVKPKYMAWIKIPGSLHSA